MITSNIDTWGSSSNEAITISDALGSYTVSSPTYYDITDGSASSAIYPSYISSGAISITDTYQQNINKLKEELGDIKKEMSDLKDYFDEKEVKNDMNTMNKANKVYKDLKKNIVDLEKTIDTLTGIASNAIDKADLLETRLAEVEADYEHKFDELRNRMSALEWEVRAK